MRLEGVAPTRARSKLRGKAGVGGAKGHRTQPMPNLVHECRLRMLTKSPPRRMLGPKSRKNCHESHERGKPTAIFSKRRKIDTL